MVKGKRSPSKRKVDRQPTTSGSANSNTASTATQSSHGTNRSSAGQASTTTQGTNVIPPNRAPEVTTSVPTDGIVPLRTPAQPSAVPSASNVPDTPLARVAGSSNPAPGSRRIPPRSFSTSTRSPHATTTTTTDGDSIWDQSPGPAPTFTGNTQSVWRERPPGYDYGGRLPSFMSTTRQLPARTTGSQPSRTGHNVSTVAPVHHAAPAPSVSATRLSTDRRTLSSAGCFAPASSTSAETSPRPTVTLSFTGNTQGVWHEPPPPPINYGRSPPSFLSNDRHPIDYYNYMDGEQYKQHLPLFVVPKAYLEYKQRRAEEYAREHGHPFYRPSEQLVSRGSQSTVRTSDVSSSFSPQLNPQQMQIASPLVQVSRSPPSANRTLAVSSSFSPQLNPQQMQIASPLVQVSRSSPSANRTLAVSSSFSPQLNPQQMQIASPLVQVSRSSPSANRTLAVSSSFSPQLNPQQMQIASPLVQVSRSSPSANRTLAVSSSFSPQLNPQQMQIASPLVQVSRSSPSANRTLAVSSSFSPQLNPQQMQIASPLVQVSRSSPSANRTLAVSSSFSPQLNPQQMQIASPLVQSTSIGTHELPSGPRLSPEIVTLSDDDELLAEEYCANRPTAAVLVNNPSRSPPEDRTRLHFHSDRVDLDDDVCFEGIWKSTTDPRNRRRRRCVLPDAQSTSNQDTSPLDVSYVSSLDSDPTIRRITVDTDPSDDEYEVEEEEKLTEESYDVQGERLHKRPRAE